MYGVFGVRVQGLTFRGTFWGPQYKEFDIRGSIWGSLPVYGNCHLAANDKCQ